MTPRVILGVVLALITLGTMHGMGYQSGAVVGFETDSTTVRTDGGFLSIALAVLSFVMPMIGARFPQLDGLFKLLLGLFNRRDQDVRDWLESAAGWFSEHDDPDGVELIQLAQDRRFHVCHKCKHEVGQ